MATTEELIENLRRHAALDDEEHTSDRLEAPWPMPPSVAKQIVDYIDTIKVLPPLPPPSVELKRLARGEPPHSEGWWLRKPFGQGEGSWFLVELASDTGLPPHEPMIWVNDLGRYLRAAELTRATDVWYGFVRALSP